MHLWDGRSAPCRRLQRQFLSLSRQRFFANRRMLAAGPHKALAAVHAIEHESLGSELLKMVVALHYGTVIYGNIGAADRLDFTVILSVNLVSRIEAVAKSLDLPLVVSDDFSRAHGGALRSLGLHKLRGLIGKIRI